MSFSKDWMIEFEWLGCKFTETIISPFEIKTGIILAIQPTIILKRWRSFLGWKHNISNFIPHLAQFWHSQKPAQKKNAEIVRIESYAKHFNTIKYKIAQCTANCSYSPKLDVRVKCEASFSGHGGKTEQNTADGLHLRPVFSTPQKNDIV